VSVVIPVYNGARYVAAAVESVLGQEPAPHQVVAVDDGSTDGSAELLLSWPGRVEVVSQENRGHAAARNAGLEVVTGAVVGFCDADDLWTPGSLRTRLEALVPGVDLVFGAVDEFVEAGTSGCRAPLAGAPGNVAGTMLLRRQAFDRVGTFDPSLRAAEFLDWLGRARHAGLVERMVPTVVLRRRLHGDNLTLLPGYDGEMLAAVRAQLGRRREREARS